MAVDLPTRILIVDDHLVLAESMARILNDQDDLAVVEIASTGAQAVRLAEAVEPDVVLMDYRLPDSDGVETARRIIEARPAIKVLLLSGHADEDVLSDALAAGCAGLVEKTAATSDLLNAVRLSLTGQSVVPGTMLRGLTARRRVPAARNAADLTAREKEVLQLLAEGLSNAVIAERMFLSRNTVRNHVQSILTKLGAHSKLEAVAVATRRGLVMRQ